MISNSLFLVVLLPLGRLDGLHAQLVNVTLDETSSLINYRPLTSWKRVNDTGAGGSSLNYGGYHMITEDPQAYASIKFTYVSLYFIASRYPYEVTTSITIDGRTTILDLQDRSVPVQTGNAVSASRGWDIIQAFPGTTNAEHIITIGINPGDPYAVVDALMFEVPSGSPQVVTTTTVKGINPSPVTSTITVTITSNTGSSNASLVRALALSLGFVSTLLFLLLFFVALWCFRSRWPRQKNDKSFENGGLSTADDPSDAPGAGLLVASVDSSTTPALEENGKPMAPSAGWRQWYPEKTWRTEYTTVPQVIVEDANTTKPSSDGTSTSTRGPDASNCSSHGPMMERTSDIRNVPQAARSKSEDTLPQYIPPQPTRRVRPLPPVPQAVTASPSSSQKWAQRSVSMYSRATHPGEYVIDQNSPSIGGEMDSAHSVPYGSRTSPISNGTPMRRATAEESPPMLPSLSLTRKPTEEWGIPWRDSGIWEVK